MEPLRSRIIFFKHARFIRLKLTFQGRMKLECRNLYILSCGIPCHACFNRIKAGILN
jgi:hypothetical protein